jgi:two-component sensor histidine kinase
LAPFLGEGGSTRVTIDGPSITIAPMAAQPLSMTLHELATNAAKYGALSAPGGSLILSWALDWPADRLRFRWSEHSGPAIAAPPGRVGFGSRMIRATIEDQLGGSIVTRWEVDGLVCDIAVPIGRSVTRAPAPEETQRKRPAGPGATGFAWPSS